MLCLVIGLGLTFTYSNGYQDGSSVTASAIGCRALKPVHAVLLVGSFEFLGAICGGSAVANTISSIISLPENKDLLPVLACGLLSALSWNLLAGKLGFPSSSTHALVGGVLGSVLAADLGSEHIVWGNPNQIVNSTGVWKVLISLFLSPLAGFAIGYFMFFLVIFLLMRATRRVNALLKNAQWLTLAGLAFGHGANDTQKSMGVLVMGLHAAGMAPDGIPLWVRVSTGLLMVVGVISLAPRVVRRVGSGIYRLKPVHGFVTQASAAFIMIASSMLGGPVSASQVTASSVMGVGAAERRKGVHWLVAKDMLVAWLLTIPAAALASALLYTLFVRLL